MNPREYEALFRTEDQHWWFAAVRREIARAFAQYAPPREHLRWLDAGSGTGGLLANLDDPRLSFRVGLEPATEGLRFSKMRSLDHLVRGAVGLLPFADGAFDVVTSVDVLCHQFVVEELALTDMRRVLAAGGILVLQVPAFDWLRSEHDDAVWTNRRYSRREVEVLLEAAGFRVRESVYRMSLLFPAAVLRRLMSRRRPVQSEARSDVRPAAALEGAFFGGALRLETGLAALGLRLPFGLSVFCVGERRD